jgi:hypothetical protein
VPQRPALLVKIGNEPGAARPQRGLNEADIVIDTPAEGFIMRYMAVYQCFAPPAVGPMRSVRWVDYQVAPEFGDPILAFAGGIDPNLVGVATTPGVSAANVLAGQAGAAFRSSDRVPPDNLYANAQSLYALYPALSVPPVPVFTFTSALPAGASSVSSAQLDFSGGTDVVWQWQPGSHTWLHTYSGAADIDALTAAPVTATNIVIQVVSYTLGPYAESEGGSGDVQSQTTGSGNGFVLRDGKSIPIIWTRNRAGAPTTFTSLHGARVGLAPGRTWIELITNTQAATGIHLTP